MQKRKHGETNRFKFIPFSERINNINVDVFHRLTHRNEDEDEGRETYLHQSLDKWTVMNRTKEWLDFSRKIKSLSVNTLPQLLNQKDAVALLFIEHLPLQNELSLQPVLELLTAFVKDVRHEFYIHYTDTVKELMKILKLRDPIVIEQTFVCLAHIFKYLVKNLVKDLDKVLVELAPLLDDSCPEYVRDFAAQSFAFVARRVKDKAKLLNLVLCIVQQHEELNSGCGKLLTETMMGIRGQPHSTAAEMLTTLLEAFGDQAYPQKLLLDFSTYVIEAYLVRVVPQHSNLFAVITDVVEKKCSVATDDIAKSAQGLVILAKQGVLFRNGIHVREPEAFANCMLHLAAKEPNGSTLNKHIASLNALLLKSTSVNLPQQVAAKIVLLMLKQPKDVVMEFLSDVFEYVGFEAMILPNVLDLCLLNDHTIDEQVLEFIAKVVVKKSYKDEVWNNYPLDFTFRCRKFPEKLVNMINNIEDLTWESCKKIAQCLIILPHVKPLEKSTSIMAICDVIAKITTSLSTSEDVNCEVFLMYFALESLSHIEGAKNLNFKAILESITPIADVSLLALKTLEILLRIVISERERIGADDQESAHELTYLEWNIIRMRATKSLAAPYHKTRCIALQILLNLEKLAGNRDNRITTVLETCVAAENVPLTIKEYRNAVIHIDELHYDKVDLPEEYVMIPLRFLLGYLFSNFSLIEEATKSALESYLRCNIGILQFVEQLNLHSKNFGCETASLATLGSQCFLADMILEHITSQDRPNVSTYKKHLWKILAKKQSTVAQRKEIIDMALNSITSLLPHLGKGQIPTCDVRKHVVGENSMADDDEGEEEDAGIKINKLLICDQLDVLPRKGHRPDITELCMNLLKSLDPQIRRHALNCILEQRDKFFSPYRGHLIDLVFNEGFQNALVHFQIDKDSGTLKEEHRPDVMPIVLRLLYSKMVASGPTHRGNKASSAALRRAQVMRFLSGCHHNEIEEFFRMAFSQFQLDPSEKRSARELVEDKAKIDLESVIPPRKLQSAINLAAIVLDHLGGHLSLDLQKYLLQVVIYVSSVVYGCILQGENIYIGHLKVLKKVKNLCIDFLVMFFTKFDNYPWTEDEISAVFKVLVWPSVDRLLIESLQSVTSIMKLFNAWSENPRYFLLLARYRDGCENKTCLTAIIELFLHKQCQETVSNAITSLLERLLTLQGDSMEVDDVSVEPIEIECVRPIDQESLKKLPETLNYGSQLLIPHVGDILEHLRCQLKRRERLGLNKMDSSVLSRITELATSAEHADALLSLLLKLLTVRPPSDEEVLVNTIYTVRNLLKVVAKPDQYARSFAPLFGSVEPTKGRKALIECLEDIAQICPELMETSTLIRDLNAYDRRWIDQCDFNKRLDALKQARKMAAESSLPLDTGMFVIYTSFFLLKCEKDLSLRDSTEMCLKEITPVLLRCAHTSVVDREHLTETLLKLIRTAIRSSDDRYKTSAVSLLGVLARECAESHFVFKDLEVVTNKVDTEVDFFENIHHLQVYRRLRALLRFTTVAKTLKKPPSSRTLTQVLLPLGSQYLCNEAYANKNSLIDAAIEYVGTICRLLPWHQYQAILKHYLLILRTKLEYQRQCVRMITTILDAFHFDLSRSKELKGQADTSDDLGTTGQSSKINANSSNEIKIDGNESNEIKENCEGNTPEQPVDGETNEVSMTPDKEADLIEDLDEISEEKEGMEQEEILSEENQPNALETIVILSPHAAARIQRALSGPLLDQLHKAIGERTAAEITHKVNKKSLGPDKDEEDIIRVPIAITLVKLLQKLPGDVLNQQLPGIITKLCTFLKSHLESVRRVTRETLQQIIVLLGPDRLTLLLSELTHLLTKGFQVHVLAFTVHAVVQALQLQLTPGDIDKNLATILQVCNANLFGLQSEEKEVVRIQVKHKEVRTNKSLHLLHLVAQFITEKCLTDLILPMKQVLSTRHSHKMQTKCRECLRQIVLGLALNKFISPENLIKFVYGATSENIPQLKSVQVPLKKPNPRERQDCLVIAPQPRSRNTSAPVKNNSRSGAHIIVEFGLHLLTVLLKEDRGRKSDLRQYFDPIVPILLAALDSQHVQVSTLSIKCLTRLLKLELPSVKENIKTITDNLFSILHKYAAAGLGKGDNFDLVLASFKMVSSIVRDAEYHVLSDEQLKLLLLYAEQDIYDNTRQAVAFGLLKSVLHRRHKSPELHGVMMKVASLSIMSEHNHVRIQARQTVHQYMMDYPLGKKLDDLLAFYIAQLKYEVESGRLSALEMIFSLINSYPESVLAKNAGLLFLNLGASIVNDDSVECKKHVAAVIKGMLIKVNATTRNDLFEMVLTWLRQKKSIHKRLAAHLAGIFVSVEKADFEPRLEATLSALLQLLLGKATPGRFVSLPSKEDHSNESNQDHLLFQVFVLLVKICNDCPNLLKDNKFRDKINQLTAAAQSLLCHEHEWVRCGAAQFLGCVFTAVKPNELSAALMRQSENGHFWDLETLPAFMKSLVLDHTSQLIPGIDISEQFMDQLMKNLVYFAKVLKDVKTVESSFDERKDIDADDKKSMLSLSWLIKRMRRIVNMEISQTPGTFTLRTAVYLWTGALAVCLSRDELSPVLYHLAAPLIREAEVAQGEKTRSPIADLVRDVTNKLKKKVGIDVFSELCTKVQAKLMEKRAHRKSNRAQEFVTDPENAVKRKMLKQQKKKNMKKNAKQIIRGKVKKKGKSRK